MPFGLGQMAYSLARVKLRLFMSMLMVGVGIVRMLVRHCLVLMLVAMAASRLGRMAVLMLMVFVVDMFVDVQQCFVAVRMLVSLS